MQIFYTLGLSSAANPVFVKGKWQQGAGLKVNGGWIEAGLEAGQGARQEAILAAWMEAGQEAEQEAEM